MHVTYKFEMYQPKSLLLFEMCFVGAESLGIPAFQALVKPSDGYALSHDSFALPPLAHNLDYVVSQTQMSIADCRQEEDSETTEGGAAPPSVANHLEGCIADVRMSRYAPH